ncbi:MAG TPA: hypothetical protein VGX70_19315, partial [Gemmataceae bacterium]|nr:hypothetical protein [Gemmataceae bacterium]
PIAEADSTTNEKETKSASDGSKNKDRTAKQDKGGSPVDPLAALQKAYQANNSPNSKDSGPTVAAASHSDLSSKDEDKDKDSQGIRSNDKSAMTKSPDDGSNSAKKQTVVRSDIQGTKDKDTNDRKASGDLEPPPIPAGLHDPFHSLPETPTVPADASNTVNRSPRDAGARKPAVASGKAADGRAATSGSNGVRTSVNAGGAVSSSTISAPSIPVHVIPSDGSSTAQTQTADANQRGSKVATISSQDSGLTPGVMPSPRSMGLAPAGDTAPEPNVRLGPPLAGPFANPSTQAPSADPASALPTSNQFAQATTPSPSSPPTTHYSDNTGRPVQPPAPKVDSYDEETYLCKQGDRFEDISMKFYQTEKYAQALLLFNRNHPRAIAAVRQDPPTLAVGQAVYIPPLRVLEKQYATAIPDHAPLNPAASPIPTNSDVRNPASGSSNSGAAAGGAGGGQTSSLLDNRNSAVNGAAGPDASASAGGGYAMPQDVRNPAQPAPLPATLPVTKTPAQGQERTYQVPKNGETFWEISRKTLGNPNRWSEIRRLNPKIEPQYPVPGGTILKMPPDARLESVNPMPVDRIN